VQALTLVLDKEQSTYSLHILNKWLREQQRVRGLN